jgi:hypothetical protein
MPGPGSTRFPDLFYRRGLVADFSVFRIIYNSDYNGSYYSFVKTILLRSLSSALSPAARRGRHQNGEARGGLDDDDARRIGNACTFAAALP